MAQRRTSRGSGDLFIEGSGQLRLVEKSAEQQALEKGKVECLGITFDSEDARRAYFIERLREKLADLTFRYLPGFPVATDETILEASDPPYYTACPNPFISDMIVNAESAKPKQSNLYSSPPYSLDLIEKRTDEIYTAHTYHTKVPPKAIARLLLHYTRPGDIVLDVFCGSGMTGVAALMCADPRVAQELGGQSGARFPILCDLSPAATFIAANYLSPPPPHEFEVHAASLLKKADQDIGAIWRLGGEPNGLLEFCIWVEAFSCPHCQRDILSERVLDATDNIGSARDFHCPHCDGLVSKAPTKDSGAVRLVRNRETYFDSFLKKPVSRIRRVPIAAQVRINGDSKRIEFDQNQRDTIRGEIRLTDWFPTAPLIEGERFTVKDCLAGYGITHIHHFYMPRQLATMACLWRLAGSASSYRERRALRFWISSNGLSLTVLNRFAPTHHSQVNRYFSGTLYVPSTVAETSYRYAFENKVKRLTRAFSSMQRWGRNPSAVTTQSATSLAQIPDDSIDYVFIDPPFGRNLQYSELNQIWEAWLQIQTQRDVEAVIDSTRRVDVQEYADLMRQAFGEIARVLKPSRWITVEFHNSSNAVWMAIQEGMLAARLVVADVRVLSKESETYKQSKQGLVKRDLMISAYKPPVESLQKFEIVAGRPQGAWEFVRMHLAQLPVFSERLGEPEIVSERQDTMLFDRMVAFHVQRGISVPLSAAEFRVGLEQNFVERDGMYFLPIQVNDYDKKRISSADFRQQDLFVHDEASAIAWLRREIGKRPQSFQDLHPGFTLELQSWSKHEAPVELREILEENFLRFDGREPVPSQIHSYLSTNFKELRNLAKDDPALIAKAADRWYVPDPGRQGDLEKLREKTLLTEFETYKQAKERKLKLFRTEAVRAGFKAAYDSQNYKTIVSVAAKLPENVLQEDEKLLMYYDVASMRLGDE